MRLSEVLRGFQTISAAVNKSYFRFEITEASGRDEFNRTHYEIGYPNYADIVISRAERVYESTTGI